MNSAYAELLNMGEPQGKKSKLDSCNELLNSEDPDDQTLEETFVGSSDTDLVRVIEMGDFKGVEGVDQGVKLRTRQKLAEKELDRRRKLKSRTWRTQAQSNQQQYANDPGKQQRRANILKQNRDFSDDTPPQVPRQTASAQHVKQPSATGASTRGKLSLTQTSLTQTKPFKPVAAGAPQGRPAQQGMRLTKRIHCSYCKEDRVANLVRHAQVFPGEGQSSVCKECWSKLKPDIQFPEDSEYQRKTLLKQAASQTQPLKQTKPAPLKSSVSRVAQQQQMSLYADKKMTTRQSSQRPARKAKQENDQEPICIDSDDDTHANGAGPARDDGQSGAAVATRHSERIRENQQTKTIQLFKDFRCVFPPCKKFDVVEVTEHDLARLDDGEFLNDTVIDFFIKYIQEHLDSDDLAKFHFFNTFFFKKLTEKSALSKGTTGAREGTPETDPVKPLTTAEKNHLRVKAWTKGVDIFSKDFLFIPIHDALHWSLIIVCHPGLDLTLERKPYILHLDSMDGSCHNLTQIGKAVRHYLNCEWQRKLDEVGKPSVAASWAEDHPGVKHDFNANTIPGKRPKVPNQDNWWDCGLFALAYMDFWTHAPPGQVEICAAGAFQGEVPYPAFLSKNWFQHTNASALRTHLRNIILKEFRQQMKLPVDHPTVLHVIEDIAHYEGSSEIVKYIGPEEYLPAAQAAEQRRSEAKAERQRQEQQRKEQKAAEEAAQKQRAREKAAQAAEARQRRSSSQELEIDLEDLPEQVFAEEGSRKRAQPDGVQDLTDDQPKRRLRSHRPQAPLTDDQQMADDVQSHPLPVRKARKRALSVLESDDDDRDVQQPDDRQLGAMQVAGEDSHVMLDSSDQTPEARLLVPDSQTEETQPGTQDLMNDDDIMDHNSAELVDQADQCEPSWLDASKSEDYVEEISQDTYEGILPAPPSVQSHSMHGKAAAAERQLYHPLLMTDPADHVVASGNGQERHPQRDKAVTQPHTISRFFAPAPSQLTNQAVSIGWGSIVSNQSGPSQPQCPAVNGFQPLQAIKQSPHRMASFVQGVLGHLLPSRSSEPAVVQSVSEEADVDIEAISETGDQQPATPAHLDLDLSSEEAEGREQDLDQPTSPASASAVPQSDTLGQAHQQSTSAGQPPNGNTPTQTMRALAAKATAGKHQDPGQLGHAADHPETHPVRKQLQPARDQPMLLADRAQLAAAAVPTLHSDGILAETSAMFDGMLQAAAPTAKRQRMHLSKLPASPRLGCFDMSALRPSQQEQAQILTAIAWQGTSPQAVEATVSASVPAQVESVLDLFTSADSPQLQTAAPAPKSPPQSWLSRAATMNVHADSEETARAAVNRFSNAQDSSCRQGAAFQHQQAHNSGSARSLQAAEAQSSRLHQQHAQAQPPGPSLAAEPISLSDDEDHEGMEFGSESAALARLQQTQADAEWAQQLQRQDDAAQQKLAALQESQQGETSVDVASDEDWAPCQEGSAWVPSRKTSRASNRRALQS